MNSKVALVTGASSGIGRSVALGLLQAGYRVALAARKLDALEQVAAESGAGERALPISCDVGDEAAVQRLFDTIESHWGRLDLLFNNAGVFTPQCSLEDLAVAQWKQAVDINLTGAFLCLQGAFRVMKRQQPRGGRIINNGSISAHAPRPQAVAYTATKHAITGLTKAASLDGRAYGIACGQIDIGNVVSDMSELMAQGTLQADGSMKVEPRMSMDNVVRAVLYMDSLPLDANVLSMTVMASHMPFVGRG
ncbi:SDR family oxidoreductase [Burkholderia gladioli]|jgi:NAD(P)-dependent dehydrogenase (short-subunit alcohol dehydrogenase family)|uniref:Short chain dehydrogenase family protein n=1 Tax=Burkholderia gladioli TaxID=28095 RepID=A0AAW7RG86_BURGA|nr:SDR family oxidoreductase [Burkholderia gladioli]AJW97699.1 short chain dehydrogenase family protein [Burkholderia gladioli]ASD79417.1 NAD(P)-dependent oxidoreductase [Burkholderia gladioli pv. gladioli]AWY55339.1 NAD(P)-dependent oxidoreductase [Burkholderia gladioli pv. gladioli]KGC10289.1 short chain dehydrogenase family protein [Burkholderia gladioli]MBJ9676882.1 SDR family oxidoreductase [Burkholderia gladioli]